MRAFFLLLLAANLAFFAWSRYYADAESTSDTQPLGRQIFPEKIRILPGAEPTKVSAPGPAPAGAPGGGAASAGPASSTPGACVEWGGFAVAEAPKAEQALVPLALGARLTQNRSQETAGWWVFIPPQGDRPAAQKKAAELKSLGIEDYFVIQDEGPLRWAISLGVFSTEEAANNRLEALRARKVRSAQTGERETQVAKVWFQVRDADSGLQERIRSVALGFPGTELRPCKG